jgi:hypothetical protein
MNKKLLFLLFILFASCNKQVSNTVVVYNNDFETDDLSNITNGAIGQFNNSAVLGPFNRGAFALTVNNLPTHDLITISFDLFIHDSWDGNKAAPDGPDIWEMLVDGGPLINATFSNVECLPGMACSPQSFPNDYPNNYNNPRTGASRIDLPGFCSLKGIAGGTSQYKIVKTFRHSNRTLMLQCLDKLTQTNTGDPKCDESWSVDNINIKAITL